MQLRPETDDLGIAVVTKDLTNHPGPMHLDPYSGAIFDNPEQVHQAAQSLQRQTVDPRIGFPHPSLDENVLQHFSRFDGVGDANAAAAARGAVYPPAPFGGSPFGPHSVSGGHGGGLPAQVLASNPATAGMPQRTSRRALSLQNQMNRANSGGMLAPNLTNDELAMLDSALSDPNSAQVLRSSELEYNPDSVVVLNRSKLRLLENRLRVMARQMDELANELGEVLRPN